MIQQQYVYNEVMVYIESQTKQSLNLNIALGIIKHYRKIPSMNLRAFSKRIDESPSNISKFTKTLGFKGYTDLKAKIQQEISGKTQLFNLIETFDQTIIDDAFYHYDTKIATTLFKHLQESPTLSKLITALKASSNVLILTPDYISNLILQFTMSAKAHHINAMALSWKTDASIILDFARQSDLFIFISSSGTWINTKSELMNALMSYDVEKYVIGSDAILALDASSSLIPISLAKKTQLFDFQFESERIYALFFSYLTLKL